MKRSRISASKKWRLSRSTTRAGSASVRTRWRTSEERLDISRAAGIPLPTTSPAATAQRDQGVAAVDLGRVDRDVVVVVAADLLGRLVVLPGGVAGGPGAAAGEQGPLDLAGGGPLGLGPEQPVVLDRHADRHGDGGQEVEAVGPEPGLAGAADQLDDPDRLARAVEQRDAEDGPGSVEAPGRRPGCRC